ncbi:DUF58 domain-containing protein [Roseibium aggregatum]|uniref:DUF58 domain-containing protein n=1 Tax=Roseibium aggregatum TaxID=187304 RepID=A0A926P0L0_9HYPH|nr:DUF58 domain-containing protein [Roseibium aggregatum]MBD1547590.1 DUF58 domain-containing protein [Roseibium aggregatum]
MVSSVLDRPGIRLSARELLALRNEPRPPNGHRPASRRPGVVSARLPGSGMDLREIRAFSEGDDTRRIDPAASARTGTLHVRSFHEDRDDAVLLIADFRPEMLWGTGAALRSVRAARLLARRGWDAVARGASVAGMSIGSAGIAALSARTGVRQFGLIAEMLAQEHDRALEDRSSPPSLAAALVQAARLAPHGAKVWLATGPEGILAGDEQALARLARRRQVTLLCPLDPMEVFPPGSALPICSGGASRIARLRPFEPGPLVSRMRGLNVTVEVLADDAG